uniref:Putative secreted protein n=1 Tax=Anopheles triannulatus TaxID=58253 RepID=A0A2M4B4H9_9DIPT
MTVRKHFSATSGSKTVSRMGRCALAALSVVRIHARATRVVRCRRLLIQRAASTTSSASRQLVVHAVSANRRQFTLRCPSTWTGLKATCGVRISFE